jgi:EAL domain-containing protein (putative c-di-GMP-specific phosphodiesterase class I)
VRGALLPSEFIPLAEESNLICDIGEWVLVEALQQLKRWDEVLPLDSQGFAISVNISTRQLSEGFPAVVENALLAVGLPPNRLVLEITESVMVQAPTAIFTALRDLGVSLAIDDFGVGFSSLSALETIPLDIVKIDKAFISADRQTCSPLVPAIVQMSEALNVSTIVEGVETPHQLAGITDVGAQLGQGYLFARPMRPRHFASFAATRTSEPAPLR